MTIILTDTEIRIVGSLMEKALSTPDYYPLSLNALTNACNQKSSRDPVVTYDESDVQMVLDALEEKNLVTSLTPYRFRIRDLDLLATFAGEDPPATRVREYDRPKRIETHFGSPISRDRMTAVNAAARGADRVNAVMKPMSMHERDLARRRP